MEKNEFAPEATVPLPSLTKNRVKNSTRRAPTTRNVPKASDIWGE